MGAGLARPVWSTGRPLWLGQLCAPEEEAAAARERRAPSRRSPAEGGDGEGGRREGGPAGGGAGAGAGRAPGRGAGPVATGVHGFSRGLRPPRRGQSEGSPRAAAPGPAEREEGGGSDTSDAARLGTPSSSAPALRGCPGRAPRPSPCRSAAAGPGPGPLRSRREPRPLRCLSSAFSSLASCPARGGVAPCPAPAGEGSVAKGPGCAAGPALGVPWKPPRPERVEGSAAEPREGPVLLRAPLDAVRVNLSFLLSRSNFSAGVLGGV